MKNLRNRFAALAIAFSAVLGVSVVAPAVVPSVPVASASAATMSQITVMWGSAPVYVRWNSGAANWQGQGGILTNVSAVKVQPGQSMLIGGRVYKGAYRTGTWVSIPAWTHYNVTTNFA